MNFFFMILYVYLTSSTCHISNDYDYDYVILWLCYFCSTMSFKFTLNLSSLYPISIANLQRNPNIPLLVIFVSIYNFLIKALCFHLIFFSFTLYSICT